MGGRSKVLEASKAALDKRELAWAGQLVNHLYRLDPQDQEVRQLKADVLRQMAYVSTGGNERAHMTSQALALEGKITLARLIPPAAESISASPNTFVDYFRVRIDPLKSGESEGFVQFEFPDGSSSGLHIRRAVAEFVEDPSKHTSKPDISLKMSGESWAKLYLSQATPEEMIASGDIEVTGDAKEAARLINLFDRYSPQKAVVIPPATLIQDHP